jgi:UPF0755 protein
VKRRGSKLRLLVLGMLLVVAALTIPLTCFNSSTGEPQRIVIAPGTGFGPVTDTLVRRGVVTNRTWFKVLARLRGLDRSVQAGAYEFRPGESAWKVLSTLQSGRTAATRFTVPEGLSLLELAALAQARLGIPSDSVQAAARDPVEVAALEIKGSSLEGFLFPETYQVPVASTARDLVHIMVRGFLEAWRPEWDHRLSTLGMSREQAVTLASIVEGEARVDEEREIIAGTYHNRLRIGMALQADPTVQYAIELRTGKPKTRLFERDYQIDSPYNTYLHPGLPPGPVNSPGLKSIEAALHPASVPYLYFVAAQGGRHHFSRTYEEHLRAVASSRRARGR